MEKTIAFPKVVVVYKNIALSFLFTMVAFCLPLFWSHPQLLVGSGVNALLFSAALFLPLNLCLPVIMAPALAAVSRGLLFGPFTIYLVYMLPFIWLGNLTLVYFFKKITCHYFFAIIASAFLKTAIIFLPTLFLVQLKIVPQVFLQSFGVFQLITALIGGSIVFVFRRGGSDGPPHGTGRQTCPYEET